MAENKTVNAPTAQGGMVDMVYKPKKGEPRYLTVPEAQAAKMLKLGRWKKK